MTVTIGADPEFFLYDQTGLTNAGGNPFVPCIGLVPGTKEEPYDLGDGYFCHEDNVCVELGIPPTSSQYEFAEHIQRGKTRISERFFPKGQYAIYYTGSVQFETEQLQSKQAQTFGCEPDYDAYTNGKVRTMPKKFGNNNMRYAGGHIHIGGNFKCPPFVAALFADLFISLPAFLNDGTGGHRIYNAAWKDRAEWYGKPGIFRPKPYGIEYRTPSNYWAASIDNAMNVGACAIRLGNFLENQSSTQLRDTVRLINWLSVQEFLSNPPGNTKERNQKAENLWSELYRIPTMGEYL